MDKFIVTYIKEEKRHRKEVRIPKGRNSSTTRAFNEFFRKIRKQGASKKSVKVKNISIIWYNTGVVFSCIFLYSFIINY